MKGILKLIVVLGLILAGCGLIDDKLPNKKVIDSEEAKTTETKIMVELESKDTIVPDFEIVDIDYITEKLSSNMMVEFNY